MTSTLHFLYNTRIPLFPLSPLYTWIGKPLVGYLAGCHSTAALVSAQRTPGRGRAPRSAPTLSWQALRGWPPRAARRGRRGQPAGSSVQPCQGVG